MQKQFVYIILNLCIDAEECVCMHAYSLLAFSLLREGFQRMQERCSSRQKSLTNPLDPAFSFTICVPDCITLMHRSTANNEDTQTQTRLAENRIKTKKRNRCLALTVFSQEEVWQSVTESHSQQLSQQLMWVRHQNEQRFFCVNTQGCFSVTPLTSP